MTKALLPAPAAPVPPKSDLIQRVARQHRVSPFGQFADMVRLNFGKPKLAFDEYYSQQLYDPALSRADKAMFVGARSNHVLNRRLNPEDRLTQATFIRDKVRYGELLRGRGLATPRAQAVVAATGGYDSIPALRSAAQVADFLRHDATFPTFGKPATGTRSIGSALLSHVEGDRIHLGNGTDYDIDAFAEEVFEDFADGFIFQDAVTQHPALTAIAGPALGSVRIVTVNDGSGPQVLYALWKIPSPAAMSDNFWQAGSMLAALDADTGTVLRVRRGSGPEAEDVTDHPVSGATIPGTILPDWDAACALAVAGHAVYPEAGIFGWDMGLSADGPTIVECNTNPFHQLYQLVHGRGILNAGLAPVFDRVAARRGALATAA